MNTKQILYYGPPGTGKTYEAREAAIRIVNPSIDIELESLHEKTSVEEKISTGINLQEVNKSFENFFEYDENSKESKSRFLNDKEYKPGKTCYRNMSALNKIMGEMISNNLDSITRQQFSHKGPSTFAQFTRALTHFDLAIEDKIGGNKSIVILNEDGMKIKEKYISLIDSDPKINLSTLRNLPEFAKQSIINSIKNTDRTNMSMWKSTIIGALWFIARNGYIFKYRSPKKIKRTNKENELLKICFGYVGEDNEFLSWVTPYLLDIGVVVESDAKDERYIKYYLGSEGEKLLSNMKIIKENIYSPNTENEENENKALDKKDVKIYRLKDDFIIKRSKLKELFSRYRDNEENNIDMITLHPSFEYENFVEGISVKTVEDRSKEGSSISYYNKSGILKDICYKALRNLIVNNLLSLVQEEIIDEKERHEIIENIIDWRSCYNQYRKLESQISWDYCDNFVLIIDEINRGDMAKVFGEVITLLEVDKRLGSYNEQVVKLPFTNDIFSIPKNVFILATMNTSDRSISNMDIALRRRFGFIKCKPNLDLVNELYTFVPSNTDDRNLLNESVLAIKNINMKLSKINFIGSEKLIGHSYLMSQDVFKDEDIINIWIQNIIPLIEEYFVGEYDGIIEVIPERFIDEDTGALKCNDAENVLLLVEDLSSGNYE